MAGEDIVANVRVNAAEFFGTLRQMNSEINSNTREWKAQFSALSRSGDWVGAYKAKLEGLNKNYDIQIDKVKLLKSKMDDIGTPKTEKNVAELKNLGNQLKTAESQVKLFDVQIKNSNLALEKSKTGIHELANEHKILSQITKANSEVFEKQGLQYTANREKALGLIAETRNLNKQYQAQDHILGSLKSAYNAYSNEQKHSDTYAQQLARDIKEQETVMTQTASAIKNNQTEYSSLGKHITNVGQRTTLTADRIKNMGSKLVTSGQSLQQFGFFSQTASAGLLSMFKQGMEGSAKLDQSLRETYNMLDKKPAGGMNAFLKDYRSEIANLSKQWGVSQNDIADGMQEVIRAGYDQKSALDIATSSMQTAMATGEDYGQIMDGTTEIMSQFGLKTDDATKNAENASRVQNALAKVANDTKTSYLGLSDAMAKFGPVAANVGYSVEESASLIGYMANKGIDAEQAGNNLRMVFQRLASQTPQASEALKELGVSVADAHGNMKKLPEIIDQIDEATKNMGNVQRQEYIKKIFGAYATTAATALLDGRSAIEKESNAAGQAVADGYTKGLAKSNIKGAAAQIKIFKAQWQALTMEFANDIIPTLIDVMKTAGNLFKEFDKLSPSTKKMVAGFVAFGAVASPLAIALGSLGIVGGTVLKTFGSLLPATVGLSKAFMGLRSAGTAAPAIEKFGGSIARVVGQSLGLKTAVTGASEATTLFGTATATSALGIAGLGVVLVGATAGFALLAKKYIDHKQKLEQVKQQMHDTYGGDVTAGQRKQVNDLVSAEENARLAVAKIGNQKINDSNLKDFQSAVDKLQQAAATGAEKAKEKAQAAANKDTDRLNNPYLSAAGKEAIKQDQSDKWGIVRDSQNAIDSAKTVADRIKAIGQKARDENRAFSSDEIKQISSDYKELLGIGLENIQGLSKKQKSALHDMYVGNDLSKETMSSLQKTNELYGKAFKSNYESQIKTVESAYEGLKGKLRQSTKDDVWSNFFKQNSDSMKPFVTNWNAQLDKISNKFDKFGKSAWSSVDSDNYKKTYQKLSDTLKAAGIDVGEFTKQYGILKPAQMDAMKTWDTMTPAMRKMNGAFNDSQKAMLNAVSGTKAWNGLSLKEQSLIINDKASSKLISATKKSGEWDKLTPKQQQLILKDLASGKIDDAKKRLKAYEDNVPKGKTLTVNDKTQATLKKAKISIDEWNKLSPKSKQAILHDLATGNSAKARASVSIWNGQKINVKDAKAVDEASKVLAGSGISVKTWNSLPISIKQAVGQDLASGKISDAKRTVDNWRNTSEGRTKNAKAHATGAGGVRDNTNAIQNFAAQTDHTRTMTTRHVSIFEKIFKRITGRASGGTVTDNETATWLGDGGKNEPYVTPSGFMGVSGSDWELHSLEPGTIVYPSISAYTQMTGNQINPDMIPAFAGGGTVPYTGQLQAVDYINSEVKNQQSEINLTSSDYLLNSVNKSNQLISDLAQIVVGILEESKIANQPLSDNNMRKISKSFMNHAVRSVN
ncbi:MULTISPECIES: phage tail tape measure protein [Leuconostoc]|uniref:phage tail tape measure protein n=1 Tax=Leuconostoc TaxID=1243 RepID=UPI0009FF9CD3|nr:phage tail tape measure protein [Leuconostoc sp. BM2]ORI73748.1 phage tail tape measure protein [Leuconostoc pseudomesenteroides]ORM43008.1 phage tail tape measure protein [Leuconostoc sp. BM2]